MGCVVLTVRNNDKGEHVRGAPKPPSLSRRLSTVATDCSLWNGVCRGFEEHTVGAPTDSLNGFSHVGPGVLAPLGCSSSTSVDGVFGDR